MAGVREPSWRRWQTLAGELRQPAQDWFVAVYGRCWRSSRAADEAEELILQRARALGERAQSWNAEVAWRLQLYVLRGEQGRLAEVDGPGPRGRSTEYATYPLWGCVLARRRPHVGPARTRRARRLSALVADDFAALPFDEEWLVAQALLAEAASLIGHREAAAVLHERLLPYAGHVTVSYPEISVGFVSRYLGILATTLERHEDAEAHFEHSLASHERTGARSWLAHTRRNYADMLVLRDGEGDAARATALLSQARDGYRALGMDHWGSVAS